MPKIRGCEAPTHTTPVTVGFGPHMMHPSKAAFCAKYGNWPCETHVYYPGTDLNFQQWPGCGPGPGARPPSSQWDRPGQSSASVSPARAPAQWGRSAQSSREVPLKQWGRSATRGFGTTGLGWEEGVKASKPLTDTEIALVLKCQDAAGERERDFEKLQVMAVVGSLVALAVGVGVGVGIKKAGWV